MQLHPGGFKFGISHVHLEKLQTEALSVSINQCPFGCDKKQEATVLCCREEDWEEEKGIVSGACANESGVDAAREAVLSRLDDIFGIEGFSWWKRQTLHPRLARVYPVALCDLPGGGVTCIMSPLCQLAVKKSDWSALNVMDGTFVQSPSRFCQMLGERNERGNLLASQVILFH